MRRFCVRAAVESGPPDGTPKKIVTVDRVMYSLPQAAVKRWAALLAAKPTATLTTANGGVRLLYGINSPPPNTQSPLRLWARSVGWKALGIVRVVLGTFLGAQESLIHTRSRGLVFDLMVRFRSGKKPSTREGRRRRPCSEPPTASCELASSALALRGREKPHARRVSHCPTEPAPPPSHPTEPVRPPP